MYLNNILKTFVSKSFILGLNFLLVILTTHFWGAEGRGIISILIADIAILGIFNSIFTGSSVSYMIPKTGLKPLLLPAILWVLIVSVAGTSLFGIFHNQYLFYLLSLTILISLLGLNSMIFVGTENIKWYNIINTVLPLFQVIFILTGWYGFKIKTVDAYFIAYLISLIILLLLSYFKTSKLIKESFSPSTKHTIKQTFSYGWKNELNNLLQFLNYRFSYFIILFYSNDFYSVGIFSVGIAITESIWIFSKSISINQFAKIINSGDTSESLTLTRLSLKLSTVASAVVLGIFIVLPQSFYGFIFGAEFTSVKLILILLSPGILSMAISGIYAHYFSALGKQNILVIKSFIGSFSNIILSVLFIPLWNLKGACVAVAISYILSSLYLAIAFYKNTRFQFSDFIISPKDFAILKFSKNIR
jgi:O-antigen/teichoic acid export membrane protein